MPASLPGDTLANNLANPAAGLHVCFDLLSGPKGSPFDKDQAGNCTTGGMSTGLGFGSPPIIGPTAPASINAAGFSDDYTPGVSKNTTAGVLNSPDSTIMYIGGGRSFAPSTAPLTPGSALPNPYTTGFGIGNAGQGGNRDAGAGPAFQGFVSKTVTAIATVANGAAIEAGFINRSGVSMTIGQSAFGSATAASGVVA